MLRTRRQRRGPDQRGNSRTRGDKARPRALITMSARLFPVREPQVRSRHSSVALAAGRALPVFAAWRVVVGLGPALLRWS
jgi:hypothetical protein